MRRLSQVDAIWMSIEIDQRKRFPNDKIRQVKAFGLDNGLLHLESPHSFLPCLSRNLPHPPSRAGCR